MRLDLMLRSLRGQLMWTQEELAEHSGISVGTIAGLEAGRVRRPHNATLRRLADALRLSEQQRIALARAARTEPADSATAESTAATDSFPVAEPALPTAVPAPAQLPNAVAGFVGRTELLRRLDDLVHADGQPRTVVILAISGTAGVGKTALAIHWAHQIRDRFPDGQLYVNLRGFDPSGQVMEPAEAIRGFLDALGVAPQRIPADLDAQAGLYRSLLAGKRMLVVLDNARDTDQVRSLLPGSSGCLVVVTSRNSLTGLVAKQAAHALTLDLLTIAEAQQLLAYRIGPDRVAAEPNAVTEIIQQCARLPLALALVAARAVAHPGFPLQALADELRHTHLDALADGDQDVDLRAVFSWSYRQLGPAAQRLFRLLGTHPGPDISAPAAASLAGIRPGDVRPVLNELTRSHLLAEPRPGRYIFHDLLRVYATELAHARDSAETRHEATRRMLDHYLHTAFAGDRWLDPSRDPTTLAPPAGDVTPEPLAGHDRAMAWFTTEHQVLLACLDGATATGFDTHAWQLAWTLHTFLYRRGHWNDLFSVGDIALRATRRLGDQAARAKAHHRLGIAGGQLGRFDDARGHLQEALALLTELDDKTAQAHTHHTLGWLCARQAQYAQALDHSQQALALHRQTNHLPGQAYALNGIGWCHAQLGQYEQALDSCTKALALFQELGDRDGEANTWDSLGNAHHHLGHAHTAVDSYQHALRLLRELGNRYTEAEILTHLGETHHATGETAAARESWQQALAILEDLDHPDAGDLRLKLTAT